MRSVAVVGLGLMGGGLASRLVSCGFEVHGFDPSPSALEKASQAGVQPCVSAEQAAASAQVLLTSLPTPEILLDAYTRSPGNGVLGNRSDQIFIDVSTVDPGTSLELERRAKEIGSRFIACPLGKGPAQAASGESPLFLGGDRDAINDASDVLNAIGHSQHYLGDVQSAATFKLVSNMIGFANLAALCEGYLLASRAGITPQIFTEAIAETGAMSYQATLRLPWIIASDFDPRFAVDLARKDLRLGVDLAARRAIPVPTIAAALQELALAAAAGYGNMDASAIVLALGGGELK